MRWIIAVTIFPLLLLGRQTAQADEMPWVQVAKDKKSFTLEPSGKPFIPWGFNYDHDTQGRLLEDYWDKEWDKVEAHFAQMKKLGANVARIHLQVGKFLEAGDKPKEKALDRLTKLIGLAEKERLYLDITSLGCYHKKDVPAWYDKLSEKDRWDAQARFWEAVVGRCAKSLHKKKLQKELADLTTEARKLTTRLKAIERRRAELMKEVDG